MAEGAYGYGKMGVARMYALIFGIAYLAVGLLELVYGNDNPLTLGDTVLLQGGTIHIVIHLAIGVLVLGSFFAGESAAKGVARIVGVVFLAVTIWNLVAPDNYADFVGLEPAELPIVYTIVHAVTAVGALFAGFSRGGGYKSAPAA